MIPTKPAPARSSGPQAVRFGHPRASTGRRGPALRIPRESDVRAPPRCDARGRRRACRRRRCANARKRCRRTVRPSLARRRSSAAMPANHAKARQPDSEHESATHTVRCKPGIAATPPRRGVEAQLAFQHEELFGDRIVACARARPAGGKAHERAEGAVGELGQPRELHREVRARHGYRAPFERSEGDASQAAAPRWWLRRPACRPS